MWKNVAWKLQKCCGGVEGGDDEGELESLKTLSVHEGIARK